ncbi:putative leader peptide [Streptomyces pseudovenezuelae]|uniref:putative leader peptide n=1 Tax=Streptomyces pseudovenezuelae TaxID=67350 RepID=UPI0036EB4480
MAARAGNIPRGQGVVPDDEIRRAPSRAQKEEGTGVPHTLRSVHLHSRPHIDLQRVSAALCRS